MRDLEITLILPLQNFPIGKLRPCLKNGLKTHFPLYLAVLPVLRNSYGNITFVGRTEATMTEGKEMVVSIPNKATVS